MALRDPREVERAVDDLRSKINSTLSDSTMPEQDRRDAVMRMTGEVSALEVQARELREHEVETLKATVETGRTVSKTQDGETVEAFAKFIRKGDVNNAALITDPDSNGGYLLPNPMREAIIDVVRAVNPIMSEATVIQMTKPGTFKVDLPKKATSTVGGWVAETDSRSATDAPTIGMQTLEAFEWYAYPEATQAFLDSVAGAEQFLIDDIAATMAETLGIAFAEGDSSNGEPTGLFTATNYYDLSYSTTGDSLDAQQILNSYFALPAKFLPTAAWYGNGATFAALSALTWPGLDDTPLVVWQNGVPTIMGKRCVIVDNAPAIGNGAFPLAFGDLRRGYAVGMHSNLSVLRDPYSNKPYVGFYATGRAGGVPWDPKAVLLLASDTAPTP